MPKKKFFLKYLVALSELKLILVRLSLSIKKILLLSFGCENKEYLVLSLLLIDPKVTNSLFIKSK